MRKVSNWISGWLEYSSPVESPLIFRTWSGIATISAALSRRVWVRVKGQRLFPNLYIILVGPPGVGKGNAMKEVRYWFEDTKNVHIAADSMTKRSFYDSLESAIVENPESPLVRDCSLAAFIEELGVFLHAGDNDFIYTLCHAYDTPKILQYKTFGAGEHHIENACFSFIAGVTPKGLKDIFSEQAMELGISARTVLVFSDEKIDVDVFSKTPRNENLEKDLKADLLGMTAARGEYVFDDEAANDVVAWSKAGMPPIPQDPRFEHYNTRRFVQWIKLCLVCAAAKREERVILREDVFAAKTVLLEVERAMPKAIESLGANPLLHQQQTAIRFINFNYLTKKKSTREAALRRQLSAEVHPIYMDILLDQLTSAKWVEVGGDKPDRIFWPRGRAEEKD